MFPVLLAEEDCSIKREQPPITRDEIRMRYGTVISLTIYNLKMCGL